MNIRFYVLYHDEECNYQIDWRRFTAGFHQKSDIRGKSRSWVKKLIFKYISGVCFSVHNRCRFFKNIHSTRSISFWIHFLSGLSFARESSFFPSNNSMPTTPFRNVKSFFTRDPKKQRLL